MSNICDGIATHFQKQLNNSRAYAEGAEWRLADTAINHPISDNPHDGTGSDAETCWDEGWNDANAGTIEACVAVGGRTAP